MTNPAQALTLSPVSFTGTVGKPFTGVATITGGVAPYVLGATALPTGLNGKISGSTLSITGAYATGSGSATVADSTVPTPLTSGPVVLTFR